MAYFSPDPGTASLPATSVSNNSPLPEDKHLHPELANSNQTITHKVKKREVADVPPLLNFTNIFRDIPQMLLSQVDSGLLKELHLIFGVNTTTVNESVSNATNKMQDADVNMVKGLRLELQQVVAILLTSVDRSKWDAVVAVRKPHKGLLGSCLKIHPDFVTLLSTIGIGYVFANLQVLTK